MTDELPPLVPAPLELHRRDGAFRREAATAVVAAAGPLEATALTIAASLGMPLRIGERARAGDVALGVSEPGSSDLGDEGYALDVGPSGVTLRAPTPAGVFRGAQTLRQLLPACPALSIVDRPRFPWRGLMLDCCRHFMSVEFVEATIDLIAQHKLNRFHWHLTEDQGWRIQLDRYPELTAVGAWRQAQDGGRYGGFYTKDDVRRVVDYARARHVVVVPEIEMPGHCVAALAARPELSCTGGPHAVETEWGIFEDVYCAGNDATFAFLEHVLDEVLELFPDPWVHIGGDEVPKDRWKDCPRCQARMQREGLRDEDELQSWFVRRMVRWLERRGRRAIGWDEILEGGLAPGAIVQSWRGYEGALAAARAGHDTIVSPTSHAYLDYPTDKIDLAKAYTFDPVPAELAAGERRHVLGGECNMWTERAPQEAVWSRVFPRALAFAERLWTARDVGYADFVARVRAHRPRLREQGVVFGEEV